MPTSRPICARAIVLLAMEARRSIPRRRNRSRSRLGSYTGAAGPGLGGASATCCERLALGRAARSKAPGKLSAVGEVPVITADSLTLAQWSPSSVIPQGCVPQVDLWVNGEAEIIDMPIEVNGQRVHWRVDYETRFLGKKGLALHREVKCQNETRLLAVACANIEVR